MMNKDVATGAVLAAFGAWLVLEARTFPTLAGMTHGPGLFPSIAGSGLIICGLLILATGLVKRAAAVPVAEPSPPMSRQAWINTGAVLASVVFFALFLNKLGFHLVAFPMLLVLLILFGINWLKSILLAVGVTVLVHLIFYSFLHVPLPWGLLEPIAW
ncbi:tripartite tricarboxylate transporter TctB family protein [Tropicimonas sediminicola]|uniref:Putative tricarboxylic transport membrane protein n=1 Tax=Tropicimonas sediminicola TaxID=1031541 RepID=A0A239EGN0_9RHOB|nr:tripartite tricarboxylate transporter TctB family protein [Tropicimonas sediminicola]SNS43910.1 putative tricarboxylic transport membrane protein [Tropicimonas sediminicola]